MKLAAILLLLLLSFNFAGYRLWFFFLQKSADTALVARLDAKQYNENDLITIKVPLRMPYQTLQTDFERVDGEIKIEGKIYKYVKRKVERGQLVLLCLPDDQKMQLQQARHTAYKLTGEVPATGKADGTKSIVVKNIFSDYDGGVAAWRLMPYYLQIQYNATAPENLFFSFYETPIQPPEHLTA